MPKKTFSPIREYVKVNAMLFAFSLIFSAISLVFIADKIPKAVQAILGIVCLAPLVAVFFITGKRQGDLFFKEINTSSLTAHDASAVKLPFVNSIWHVIGYVALPMIVILIGVIIKNFVVRNVAAFVLMPITLFFMGINVLDLMSVNAISIAVYLPMLILLAGVFIFGYVLSVLKQKKHRADIENELRMARR